MASVDLEKWDKDIDSASANKQELYDQLKEAANASPNDVNYLWRLTKGALVLSDLAEKNKSKDKCKNFVSESLVHAKKAIEADPKSLEAHKWYARFAHFKSFFNMFFSRLNLLLFRFRNNNLMLNTFYLL